MLTPLVKYPGGKEKELKYILPNLPSKINSYYEPFVGAGAVYFAISDLINKKYINDKSEDLIRLYYSIKNQDHSFFQLLTKMDEIWVNIEGYVLNAIPSLWEIFNSMDKEIKNDSIFDKHIIIQGMDKSFPYSDLPVRFLCANLKRKFNYLLKQKRNCVNIKNQDFNDIILTAYKSSIYMQYRYLYNISKKGQIAEGERAALYLFLRQYAYSSMFRFSKNGDFNVPYGGKSYNNIRLETKIKYYKKSELIRTLNDTIIGNTDFEIFLNIYPPQKNDFLFIDPPYDSDFSKYDNLSFDAKEQKKLSRFLIEKTIANWMIVIKDTQLIREIYPIGQKTANNGQIYINNFEKTYNVNFRNRNIKKTRHLMITNYEIK